MSSNRIKIEDRDDLVKDENSGAILLTNLDAVKAYKARKNEINKMRMLESQVNTMGKDIQDIKSLLQQLLTGKDNQ